MVSGSNWLTTAAATRGPCSSGFRRSLRPGESYNGWRYCRGYSQYDTDGVEVTPPTVSHAVYHGDSADNGASRPHLCPVDLVGLLGGRPREAGNPRLGALPLARGLEEIPPDAVSFRALSKMTARQRDRALSAGRVALLIDDWIDARFKLPAADVPTLTGYTPEAAAEVVRARWGLGERPVSNMLHLLEARGVRIYSLTAEITNSMPTRSSGTLARSSS
jgi:hypothetical protein